MDGMRSLVGGQFDARKLLSDGATILGFDLPSSTSASTYPPAIVSDLAPGAPPSSG
jgi:hypothetical protein